VNEADDAELVKRSLAGNREAFALVVARYQSLVCSLAYAATGSLSQSEDLAQETFVAAWKQLGDLREPEKLRAWLCGIARNLGQNARRRQRREPAHAAESLEESPELAAREAMPSEAAVTREEETILWRALARLPENYREPLILFYREQQSVERVAVALDLSEDVVRQRLSRGRKLLEEEVSAFLAGALARSAPGAVFTMSVVAMLPALTMTGKAVGLGTVAAKGGAMAKFSVLAAAVGDYLPVAVLATNWLLGRRDRREAKLQLERVLSPKARRELETNQAAGRRDFVAILVMGALGFTWEIVIDDCAHPLVFPGITTGMLAAVIASVYFRIRQHHRRGEGRRAATEKLLQTLPLKADEYRSGWSLLGLPLVHVVRGRSFGAPAMRHAPVKAWIAIATLWEPIPACGVIFAFGRTAFAPVCFGGLAVGVMPIGGCAIGVLPVGALALGGWALGPVALGRMAAGMVSAGWVGATGIWVFARDFASGGAAYAAHVNDHLAAEFFDRSRFFSAVEVLGKFRQVGMLVAVLGPLWWERRARQAREKIAAMTAGRKAPH